MSSPRSPRPMPLRMRHGALDAALQRLGVRLIDVARAAGVKVYELEALQRGEEVKVSLEIPHELAIALRCTPQTLFYVAELNARPAVKEYERDAVVLELRQPGDRR